MELGLCTKPEPWIDLFQCRDFSAAMEIHSSFDRQQCVWFKDILAPPPESQFMRTFGSVVFDISCLQECVTPLDKLQLLVSALRKATSVLSELRMKQMLSNSECWKWASFRTCILPFSLLSFHSFVVISCSFPAHFLPHRHIWPEQCSCQWRWPPPPPGAGAPAAPPLLPGTSPPPVLSAWWLYGSIPISWLAWIQSRDLSVSH